MENEKIIKQIKEYLRSDKSHSVKIKWFVFNKLGLQKNARDIDIINQSVVNGIWFKNYMSHNPNDIAIKYPRSALVLFVINTAGILLV